ncbi:MAG: alcohol dehydrogenase catalytic domain-containing protein, partial [Victivallales bacterium]|nr:alcohol dehydrogenase catalytic domain-containing protein [Victivallales bacterium]
MESIPTKTLAWRLYGAGLENFGNQDAPDNIDIRPLKDDEILTKVEAIGLCFSDIKIIRLGGNHLKLWEKDLKNHPLIIGHEAILTIVKKGPGVPDEFEFGKRYLVQPDIYIKGRCCAYGYGKDGGLTQYSIIDHRVWRSEDG